MSGAVVFYLEAERIARELRSERLMCGESEIIRFTEWCPHGHCTRVELESGFGRAEIACSEPTCGHRFEVLEEYDSTQRKPKGVESAA